MTDQHEPDQSLTATMLADHYGWWGEHPTYPREDWAYEVAQNDTSLGYWAWVEVKLSYEED